MVILPLKGLGRQTLAFAQPPVVLGWANAVGKKEGEGPLRTCFDYIAQDDTFGQQTWEKAEQTMQKQALTRALEKCGQTISNVIAKR